MPRTITEAQYEALSKYRDGFLHWIDGSPAASLASRGLLSVSPHDRSMFSITKKGESALLAFETRYGIHV